jgi:hypothetical protein
VVLPNEIAGPAQVPNIGPDSAKTITSEASIFHGDDGAASKDQLSRIAQPLGAV